VSSEFERELLRCFRLAGRFDGFRNFFAFRSELVCLLFQFHGFNVKPRQVSESCAGVRQFQNAEQLLAVDFKLFGLALSPSLRRFLICVFHELFFAVRLVFRRRLHTTEGRQRHAERKADLRPCKAHDSRHKHFSPSAGVRLGRAAKSRCLPVEATAKDKTNGKNNAANEMHLTNIPALPFSISQRLAEI